MARDYRPNIRESNVISRLDSAKEAARAGAINQLYEVGEDLANRIAMKLIEQQLIETKNKKELERQISGCIKTLIAAEDFDVQYQISPLRTLVRRPNFISLYITAFIIEKLINHRTIVDIYGTDEEIYESVNSQVNKMIRM
ncbi:MAG: hypothetical protein JSV47_09580 [Deltaproteobacteria bacterium]|nr:MAG: hypothetical protein JSV47_09580 [Deltaproteobacteria bacterium]